MKDLDKITTEMMEHICDKLCRFPREAEDQEELEVICANCKMGQFVCDIINPGKSNYERMTIDQMAHLMYESGHVDNTCKGEFAEDGNTLVCPDGQTGEKHECIECIKKWLQEEAVD